MRMLVLFEKTERLRHIGHLDIMRAMQRALRRSGVPVSYSNGFNPHMLLTFASPLSVGIIGERELMEVTLSEERTPEDFLAAMRTALPPEMPVIAAWPMPDKAPALMAAVQAAEYEITPLERADALLAALPGMLAQAEIITDRKTKSGVKPCDIRPLILSLRVEDGTMHAVLTLSEREACKPDMLLNALSAAAGIEKPRCRIVRKGLLGRDEAGELRPLEALYHA